MVPGKTYKPEDYVEILWRRKWLAIVPFIAITVGTAIGTQFLPDRYRSEARVLIVPQQVPQNYVQPTITTPLDQRLQTISAQILSRTQLERIIQEFNLYPEERATNIMEDVVARMRRDVRVNIDSTRGRRGDSGAFTVGFEAENPRTAMRVAERLAFLFVSENLQNRTLQADQTSVFLEAQLEEARRSLIEHEQKREAFRRRYDGQLPSQVATNLQVMQSTQTQLQALVDSVSRDRDRLIVIDQTIANLLSATNAAPTPALAQAGRGVTPEAPAAQQLAEARAALAGLELRLTPEHPDLIRARRIVRDLEVKAEAEAVKQPLGAPESVPSGLSSADQQRLAALRTERETVDRRLARSQDEEQRLQQTLATYRARVEAAPSREAELVELTRDYDTLQQQYQNLLTKSQQSRIAADLERRQIGEQFRTIDAARLPERPISPDRPRLNLMGALAGLGLGLALVALFEYRDTSLRTDADAAMSLALPVLAVIPLIRTTREIARGRRRRWAVASLSTVAALGTGALVAWKMDLIEAWLR